MDKSAAYRKLHYRAHHRGTREADAMVGGFFDHYSKCWSADDVLWFERLLEEQDVDIMGWAMETIATPDSFAGDMIEDLKRLDFIKLPEGLQER
ncbi:MAG: succinate dehydrogenase assembly factor 2 [Sphingorhabdus sp.]